MSFLDFIYPKFCVGCGRFGTYCCSDCLYQVPILLSLTCPVCGRVSTNGKTHIACHTTFGVDGLISIYPYMGLIKRVIKQVKYRYAYRIISDLIRSTSIEYVLRKISFNNLKDILLIPIPLHPSRLHERGFNQSEIIAATIATYLHCEVQVNVLKRIRKTMPQVNMKNREERIKNMHSAFSINPTYHIPNNTTIVLVDDVYTTGATMQSAAFVLKQHGARNVWGFTLAQ